MLFITRLQSACLHGFVVQYLSRNFQKYCHMYILIFILFRNFLSYNLDNPFIISSVIIKRKSSFEIFFRKCNNGISKNISNQQIQDIEVVMFGIQHKAIFLCTTIQHGTSLKGNILNVYYYFATIIDS